MVRTAANNSCVDALAVLQGLCVLEDGESRSAAILFDSALADYARTVDLKVAPAKALAELYRKQLSENGR